jgi:hypothetical protein
MGSGVDALSSLKDIHLPQPIGFWPLAPLWYVLLLFLGAALISLILFLHRKRRHARPKLQALRLLDSYKQQYEKTPNTPLASARISELLRRVALVYYPRDTVASLHGRDWLGFLNATGRGTDFNTIAPLLLDLPFKQAVVCDVTPLFHMATIWIKQRGTPCLN